MRRIECVRKRVFSGASELWPALARRFVIYVFFHFFSAPLAGSIDTISGGVELKKKRRYEMNWKCLFRSLHATLRSATRSTVCGHSVKRVTAMRSSATRGLQIMRSLRCQPVRLWPYLKAVWQRTWKIAFTTFDRLSPGKANCWRSTLRTIGSVTRMVMHDIRASRLWKRVRIEDV